MKVQLNKNIHGRNYAQYLYFVLGTVLSTFTYTNLFIAQNNPVRQVLLLSLFYKWGNTHREIKWIGSRFYRRKVAIKFRHVLECLPSVINLYSVFWVQNAQHQGLRHIKNKYFLQKYRGHLKFHQDTQWLEVTSHVKKK